MATGKCSNPTLYYDDNLIDVVGSVNITDFASSVNLEGMADSLVGWKMPDRTISTTFEMNTTDPLVNFLDEQSQEGCDLVLRVGPWYFERRGRVIDYNADIEAVNMSLESWFFTKNGKVARFLRWLYPKTHFVRVAWWDIRHAVSLGRERDG